MPEARGHTGLRKVAVIGLGNEMLSDDGVGIVAVRELRKQCDAEEVEFSELSVGGLTLMDHIIGSDLCIIIDAVHTGDHPPGTLLWFLQPPGGEPATLTSSHQIDLAQVLSLARLMGGDIPRTLLVWGIEAQDISTFHEGCTEEVAAAVPHLVEAISTLLREKEKAVLPSPGIWQVQRRALPSCLTTEHT